MFGLRASDIDLILQILRRYPDIDQALVFGSRSMGNYKLGSDIDIALKGNLKAETLIDLKIELNERIPLPYRFDLLDYSDLPNPSLVEHIDRYGTLFYQAQRSYD